MNPKQRKLTSPAMPLPVKYCAVNPHTREIYGPATLLDLTTEIADDGNIPSDFTLFDMADAKKITTTYSVSKK